MLLQVDDKIDDIRRVPFALLRHRIALSSNMYTRNVHTRIIENRAYFRSVNLSRIVQRFTERTLIGGRREPNCGFSATILGNFVRIGEGSGNNRFLDELSAATGAFWRCDSLRSIERKARDIRKHLAKAVRQLPEDTPGVVHVGLETLDGQMVEAERYRRVVDSVRRFDSRARPTIPRTAAWAAARWFGPTPAATSWGRV